MTEFRTLEQIGGMKIYATGKQSPKYAAHCKKVGVVFCINPIEAEELMLRWDFVQRAKLPEVHALHKQYKTTTRKKS